ELRSGAPDLGALTRAVVAGVRLGGRLLGDGSAGGHGHDGERGRDDERRGKGLLQHGLQVRGVTAAVVSSWYSPLPARRHILPEMDRQEMEGRLDTMSRSSSVRNIGRISVVICMESAKGRVISNKLVSPRHASATSGRRGRVPAGQRFGRCPARGAVLRDEEIGGASA